MRNVTALLTALLLALGLAGCGAAVEHGPSPQQLTGGSIAKDYRLAGARFTVGSKEFTENVLLGKIIIYAMRAAGAEVVDQTKLSGSATVRVALQTRAIDMYWDYAGTGWTQYLKHTDLLGEANQQFQATAGEDLARNQVRWVGPAAFGDAYAVARRSNADGALAAVHTMSDMARFVRENPDEGTFCGASEFMNREFETMQRVYDVRFEPENTHENALALDYVNVAKGSPCNFAEVTTTDSRLRSLNLTVLRDDKTFTATQLAALTMREETFRAHPDLGRLGQALGAKLTEPVMIELNGRVDLEGQSPDQVAGDFLRANGFIG
ncbi:glycine betaine ABC transporter substrate-binding protein [Pseudonocardia eucalypti]|uniref:Glycine betaine ABC transporter substrate-binding protein n=1 Tax=Pseudonocardia eucalypti TaxID=648755 RepID=A0ABP9PCR2_9PSEU|nr:osmoprotectant transport system substrate-binding protein [Pseudonocardia eucalypti]